MYHKHHAVSSDHVTTCEGGVFLIKGSEGKAAFTLSDSSSFI